MRRWAQPGFCQQESRSVSMAHAGPGPQTAPDAYTFADDAPRPVPTPSSTSSTQWSRPIRIDVCSMFARMPRYAPTASGIRSESRIPETGQNGSSRHVLALLSISSRRITKHSSGLLIRGFGVQVPGGAPVLTWGFINPGLPFTPGLSPFCSRARSVLARRSDGGPTVACQKPRNWSRPVIGSPSGAVTQGDNRRNPSVVQAAVRCSAEANARQTARPVALLTTEAMTQ